MRRPAYFFFLSLITVTLFIPACQKAPREGTLTILYTLNVNGELERCGCSEKQLGGVARRKTVIDQHRSESSLVLDAGDIFFGSFQGLVGSREFYRYKCAAIVRAMNVMGYDGAIVGDYDFAQGHDFLRERMKESTFPFICANLVDRDGKRAAEPYQIFNRGGLRVAVTGFLDANVVTDVYRNALGEMKIQDPFMSAKEILPELAKQSDLIIALVHFNIISVDEFLKTFPQIHVALLGHTQGEGTPVPVANTITVYGSDLGQTLGKLVVKYVEGKGIVEYSGNQIPIGDEFISDQQVEEVVTRFNQTVEEKRFSEDISFLQASTQKNNFLGADQCRPCHPLFYEQWSATPHAYAFDTLKDEGYEYNPECVVCHVVGYRDPNGFVGQEKTSHLSGVQCESCHGAGGDHLAGTPMKSGVPEDVCRECHNEKHSPGFDVPLYYERSNQCTLAE
jgi:2',3'-cyclic-nucleotide 2'-phosphodiesterase (5'-nucleotidase family)